MIGIDGDREPVEKAPAIARGRRTGGPSGGSPTATHVARQRTWTFLNGAVDHDWRVPVRVLFPRGLAPEGGAQGCDAASKGEDVGRNGQRQSRDGSVHRGLRREDPAWNQHGNGLEEVVLPAPLSPVRTIAGASISTRRSA